MEQIINGVLLLVSVIAITIFLKILWNLYQFYKKTTEIKEFPNYLTILEYHMSKAYDIIYKDRILVYSLEATRIKDEDFNRITEDFVRLVIKFIGPSLYKTFCEFYGDENTFIFNVAEYFNNKYEEDAIRKQTIDEITTEQQPSEGLLYEQGTGS